ncbi:MAG: flagellar export chaperone FlgN, partial [Verrucomicrobiae bacterium]|nr:flagellar export chaperone FlgN [Verrucomicrobiae bacterium]
SLMWQTEENRTLGNFIRQLTHESKPLLEELFGEINRLIRESKRQLERNQMLYRRAWDLGQEMLRTLHPQEDFSETYKRNGYFSKAAPFRQASYIKMA